jgi:methionyl-tRNA formyltransferase
LARLRLVFAGTPDFSAQIFGRLLADSQLQALDWVGALTQPGRPQGRGRKIQPSPVQRTAEAHGIPVCTPTRLSVTDPEGAQAQAWLAQQAPDLLLVVAYGLLLPRSVLELPRRGCLNLHASILPRWRGAAPIQRALQANDAETGVCLMQMEEGLDTGPVWAQRATPIEASDTFGTLYETLLDLGSELLRDFFLEWPFDHRSPHPQPSVGVSYAHKLSAQDQWVRFAASALTVFGQIRAVDPLPSARCMHRGQALKCGGVSVREPTGVWGRPGEILSLPDAHQGLVVACETGAIELGWLQQAGGKRLPVMEFCRGYRIEPGEVLGDLLQEQEDHV